VFELARYPAWVEHTDATDVTGRGGRLESPEGSVEPSQLLQVGLL
jgi:hypothetical protein